MQMLLIALIISLCCVAVHVATWKGMILHSASISIENTLTFLFKKVFCMSQFKAMDLTLFVLKPFYRCIICMSSIWTILFWFNWNFNLGLMILVVCGLNTIITALISNILPDE